MDFGTRSQRLRDAVVLGLGLLCIESGVCLHGLAQLPEGTLDLQDLFRRECEILEFPLRDLSIGVATVKVRIRHLYGKLHVRCRVDLFVKFGEVNRAAPPLGSPEPVTACSP